MIKRINSLIADPEDYNYKGGSRHILYKGYTWSRDLPSDPEIIASVFSRLLDDAYFYDEDKLKNGRNHYLDLTQVNLKLADD